MATEHGGNEAASFDLVDDTGHHAVTTTRASVYAALEYGAEWAEQQNWYAAVEQEFRPEAEAAKVIDLNAAIASVIGGAS